MMERVMGMTAMDGGNTGNAGAIASANQLLICSKAFSMFLYSN